MSTPTITPSDPQAMPLADLKQAAGLGTPAEPAAPPVAGPPPPPAVPEKFTVSQDDNGVVITLSPEYGGEVFKGKDFNEVVTKLAGSKADTNAYVKQLKSQPATPPPVVTPAAPPPVDPAVQATRDWLLAETAAGLGMTPEEYKARVGVVFKTTEQMATNIAVADFHQMCPGYTDTPENSAALSSYFPEDFNRFPNAQELKQAYALAVLDGKITPASAQPQTPAARPPIMPSAGGSGPTGDQNAWTMPLDQLKTQAGLG
jgi:hypothetical protein